MSKSRFINLDKTLPEWVKKQIITQDQSDKILSLYPPDIPGTKGKNKIVLPKIMAGLASVLLIAGLFMFYASNWRYMPVSLKLIQIFLLIIGFYSLSFRFYLKDGKCFLYRMFLILGMISFGICMTLIAQVYHISAHPSDGVLVWAIMVLLTTAVCREKAGIYLATVLLMIWNIWEFSVYYNPNYLFALFIIILGVLSWREKSISGQIICIFMSLLYFYQVNILLIDRIDTESSIIGFVALHMPYGLLIISLCLIGEKFKEFFIAARIFSVIGWLFVFFPLLALSWPIDAFDKANSIYELFISGQSLFVPVQYIAVLCLSGLCLYFLKLLKIDFTFSLFLLMACVLLFGLPISVTSLMIATHLGILLLIFAMLYFNRNKLENILAIFFTAIILLSKGFGLVGLGLFNSEFLVAYTVGFIILATIIFLINQTVVNLVKEYSGTLLKIMIIVLVFLSMYVLSIDIRPQNSIFDTDKIIIIMIIMFSIIAMALFAYLIARAEDKLPISIAAVIFFTTSGILFLARPRIPWLVYSLTFNLLLFVIEGVIIYYSTKFQSKGLMILGILFFLLHVVTRYFDLLWDLLSGSFLFIVTALLIFLGGYLIDRQRKKVILKKEA